jgi:hypothetical protein
MKEATARHGAEGEIGPDGIFHYAQMPADAVIRNMELFMEHVKPALDELTEYAPAGARA